MTLLDPNAIWWLLLAVPIALVYLLRLRSPRHEVGASMIWRQVVGDGSTSPTRRRAVSACCQLALLALLIVALVEPTFSERAAARRIVLVIDTSASMTPAGDETDALHAAKRRAAALIDTLRRHDKMAILSAGEIVRRHIGFSDHGHSLHAALDGVVLDGTVLDDGGGGNRVTEAVRLARRMIETDVIQGSGGQIVVLSDAAFEGATSLAAADDVQLISLGGQRGNLAITRFAVRENFLRSGTSEVFVEVTNLSGEPVETTLLIAHDGRQEKVLTVKVASRDRWSETVEFDLPEGGKLTATLQLSDAVTEDNVAELMVPASRSTRVALVTQGKPVLRRALEALPKVQLTVVDDVENVPSDVEVTVLDAVVPNPLPPGPLLVINPTGSSELWRLAQPLDDTTVDVQRPADGLLRNVRLDQAYLSASRQIVPLGDAQVLAENAAGDPLYLRIRRPAGDVLLLAADPDKGDLRLHESFPLLVAGAIDSLSGRTTKSEIIVAEIPLMDHDRWAALDATEPNDAQGGMPLWPAYAAIVLASVFLLVEWQAFHQRWIL
ncbi:MAG: VWA domain-containing protein [Planctomycetes bacterium]|nr:VWA domain-containing protein [Planctomycetota bacterium]